MFVINIQMMGRRRRTAGIRQRAESRKQKMRERRAVSTDSADALASNGLGEPSPVMPTEGKSPNALRLVTPQGSLSIPCRDVPPRSDSPPCVCTPPSVPPEATKGSDGAGQTNTTGSVPSVCTTRVPSPLPCDAVVENIETKVARNLNETKNETRYEMKNRTEIESNNKETKLKKSQIREESDSQTNKLTISKDQKDSISRRISEIERECKITTDSASIETCSDSIVDDVTDVIFVQETEPEIYPFTPLCLESKQNLAKQFGFVNAFSESNEKCSSGKMLLAKPNDIKPICGDGNCFFRALSYSVCDTEENHMFFRTNIVNHMLANDTLFRSHLRSGERSVSNYVSKKRMLHNGTWATEVEILAAADFLKTDIYIYEDSWSTWLKFSAKQVRSLEDINSEGIYLIHTFQAHYDVVVDVMEKESPVETFAGNKQSICYAVQSREVKDRTPLPVQGHFDQSDPRFLDNAGKQCVMNSLSALIYSCNKSTTTWTACDVDQILTKGNEIYGFLQRSSTIEHDLIAIHEIPRSIEYNDELYNFTFQESLMGTLGSVGQNLDEFQFFTLDEALTISLVQQNSKGAFVTFKGNTFVIIKQDDFYCICDSHSRNLSGRVDPNGASTVIHYQSLGSVLQHCISLAESMAYKANDMFEITAVDVSKATSSEPSSKKEHVLSVGRRITLESYFQDQAKRKQSMKFKTDNGNKTDSFSISTCSRKDYMRAYMKRRRQSSIQSSLQEKDKKRKRHNRKQDPEKHKAIDLQSKIKAREKNPEKHRAIDLQSKTNAREKNPEKHRAIDLQSKTSAREKNPEKHRAIDLQSKTNAREKNPQKHREIDLHSKVNARDKNPQKVRAAEMKHKTNARKRNPTKYREIDQHSKTNARGKNPEKHRAIDLQSKTNAREKNPEKHRAVDLQSKTNAREKNPEKHRAVDLQSKTNAREKNPEKHRAVDLQSKTNAREKNPEKHRAVDLQRKQC
ncbi:uncharacterized protein [Argopecten irradians]|uniref:uncharacterized protein n=1 Tax=Argopecten irradians TaxID=31199 RepID=UPI00371FBE2F